MPANESIIAVPISVEQQGQTRQFLVRLVERLDIVLGYRGNDPYVSSSQLDSASASASASTINGLTQLEQTVLNVIADLFTENGEAVSILLDSISEETTAAIEDLKSASTIANADATRTYPGGVYVQAEADDVAAQVVDVASQLNDLLIALRGTGIIAT